MLGRFRKSSYDLFGMLFQSKFANLWGKKKVPVSDLALLLHTLDLPKNIMKNFKIADRENRR